MIPAIAGRSDRIAAVDPSLPDQSQDSTARTGRAALQDGRAPGTLPGNRGADLKAFAAETHPVLNPDCSPMMTRCLVVFGDKTVNPHLRTRSTDWHTDLYRSGPGADALPTLSGVKHGIGGIAGY